MILTLTCRDFVPKRSENSGQLTLIHLITLYYTTTEAEHQQCNIRTIASDAGKMHFQARKL